MSETREMRREWGILRSSARRVSHMVEYDRPRCKSQEELELLLDDIFEEVKAQEKAYRYLRERGKAWSAS